VQVRILSRCPLDPFRQRCPYCKGAGYFERWLPLALVRYVVGGMSYIILSRRVILPPLAACSSGGDSHAETWPAAADAIAESNADAHEGQVPLPR